MLKVLNKKQTKEIINKLKKQYEIKELTLDYIFLINTNNKIYIINKDLKKLDQSKLRINSIGLYFAALDKQKRIRLTIEGTQLIGKKATKNVLEIQPKELKEWIKGYDLKTEKNLKDFIIIKYKNYFLGSGLFTKGIVKNFISKARRLTVLASKIEN